MEYHVRHETEYTYSQPVTIEHTALHLSPRPVAHQTCKRSSIQITPTPSTTSEGVDYFGNPVSYFTIEEPHQSMWVVAESVVSVDREPADVEKDDAAWETVRDGLATDVSTAGLDAYQFTFDSPTAGGTKELAAYARAAFAPGRPVMAATRDLTSRIHRDFRFDPRTTDVTTPVSQVFAQRSGVCQDFAHLMIACLRSLGLAARYVSGYLRTEPPPGQPRMIGADASHAWVGVFCPGPGWIDFDPTNNQIVRSDHVTLAWGRDYTDIAPVKGLVLGGGEHTVIARVDVAIQA